MTKTIQFWDPYSYSEKIQKVFQQFISAIYPYCMSKLSWVLFAEFGAQSLAMKQNAEFMEDG